MTTLNWDMRDILHELRPDGRLAVLIVLILRSNIRLRCWPSTDLIVSDTGWSVDSVVDARKWLEKHKAVVLVPYSKRVDEEEKLPRRQIIYQLTGVIQINDRVVPYLFLSPESTRAIKAVLSEVRVSKTLVGKTLPSRTKGISIPEGGSSLEGDNTSAPSAEEKPLTPVQLVFNAIGQHLFGKTDQAGINSVGGRIGPILYGSKTKKHIGILEYERVRSGGEPDLAALKEAIAAFWKWYRDNYTEELKDSQKVIDWWTTWREKGSPDGVKASTNAKAAYAAPTGDLRRKWGGEGK